MASKIRYRPQTKAAFYDPDVGPKPRPPKDVRNTLPKRPTGVRPQARPGSFKPPPAGPVIVPKRARPGVRPQSQPGSFARPKIVTTKRGGGSRAGCGGGGVAAGAGRAGPGYVPPQLPDFHAPPTQTPMADLAAQTRALVETVYGPQRQQIEQQIADEAARSQARAAQMAGIYEQLGQFVRGEQGDIQGIYRNAAGDMANFNKGWSDGANLSAAQASAAEQANLNYLGSPQTAAPYGSAGKIAEAGQQIAGALETAGAGWGSYAATLPGIYTRMGALDIRQMLGEGAQRETQLRQGLTELGSKEAADILDYLTQQQQTQAQAYQNWQEGRARYQQWAFEQGQDWRRAQAAALATQQKQQLDLLKFQLGQRQKAREFQAGQKWKAIAATQAQQRIGQGQQRIGVSKAGVLLGIRRENRADATEAFQQRMAIQKGDLANKRYYQGVARDLSKSGTMYVYDPQRGVRVLRDTAGNPVLTADERHFQRTIAIAEQTLNLSTMRTKAGIAQRWAGLRQQDRKIQLSVLKVQEQIRQANARLKLAGISADQRQQTIDNLKSYRDKMVALRNVSNQLAAQRVKISAGSAQLTQQNKRETAINKVRTAIWRDMPTRVFPPLKTGEHLTKFQQIYRFYLGQYQDTLKPWDAVGDLDRIIRAAMPYRKFGKKKTGAGTTGAPWAQTP